MSASKILILKPRLDVSFKNFGTPVPKERGPIIPLRKFWAAFAASLKDTKEREGHFVEILEKPLWQFEPEDCKGYDIAYVPHKDAVSFKPEGETKALYYMQTVFPWLFTIDPQGWGASMKKEIKPKLPPGSGYAELKAWAEGGNSKFEQHDTKQLVPGDCIFFPCQLPHDETIKLHSKVSVEAALRATAHFCKKNNLFLVVKEHPANIESMQPLFKAFLEDAGPYSTWYKANDVSIHTILKDCQAVFTVNSGVGMEALLYNKPVFHFGDAEYREVAYKVNPIIDNIEETFQKERHSAETIESWLETFYYFCYDVQK